MENAYDVGGPAQSLVPGVRSRGDGDAAVGSQVPRTKVRPREVSCGLTQMTPMNADAQRWLADKAAEGRSRTW